MSLEKTVMDKMKAAMLSKDEVTLRTLRAIKAAILVEKTAGAQKATLTEEEEMKLINKMIKQRQDSLSIFQQQNRPDLAETEEQELAVLMTFLPPQLDENAIKERVSGIISELGVTSIKDMGKVMGAANKALAGQATGQAISAAVKALLS